MAEKARMANARAFTKARLATDAEDDRAFMAGEGCNTATPALHMSLKITKPMTTPAEDKPESDP